MSMNIDERIAEIVQNDRYDGNDQMPAEETHADIKQLIRDVRLIEAGLLAEKVLNLLPKGSPIELDIGTTIESHLSRRRMEARDNITLIEEK